MLGQRVIEALRSLELPVSEIESTPVVGLLNPVILTVLLFDFIDLLPPHEQTQILRQQPIETLLDSRRMVSALEFLYLYNCMASSHISLSPIDSSKLVLPIKTVHDLYNSFRIFLLVICRLLEKITLETAHLTSTAPLNSQDSPGAAPDILGLSPLLYYPKNSVSAPLGPPPPTVSLSNLSNGTNLMDSGRPQLHSKLPVFTFTEDEVESFTYQDCYDLPLPLESYIYSVNFAVLRRVGVSTAPHDVNFMFNLTAAIGGDDVMWNRGTYYVSLHEPAPIILQPRRSTFDQLEPELVELVQLRNTSDSSTDDEQGYSTSSTSDIRLRMLQNAGEHVLGSEKPVDKNKIDIIPLSSSSITATPITYTPTVCKTDRNGVILNFSTTSVEKEENIGFSNVTPAGLDKLYEVSPTNSQHNSFHASFEENKSYSSPSQSTSNTSGLNQYISDIDDFLPASRVKFNETVEVDSGRYYKLKPFDEMQDIISSTTLINNMSVHIHELEQKVASVVAENVKLTRQYNHALAEHEHERSTLELSLKEALQRIKTLETRILELEIKQSSEAYFTKLVETANSIRPVQNDGTALESVPRSFTAHTQRSRKYPQISFSPTVDDAVIGSTRSNMRSVHVTAILSKAVDEHGRPQIQVTRDEPDLELQDLIPTPLSYLPTGESTVPAPSLNSSLYQLDQLAQFPGAFANLQKRNITPVKSTEQRQKQLKSDSIDEVRSQLTQKKKAKKQHTPPHTREKKIPPSANSDLVKDMLNKIITDYSGEVNKLKTEKCETHYIQIRSISAEKNAPMKPPGSPSNNARKFRHATSGNGLRQ